MTARERAENLPSSSATAPLPTLHQLFGTDSQKTSVSLHILLTHFLISPISSARTFLCYIPFTTENKTLSDILSRFYTCATTRTPSSPTATVGQNRLPHAVSPACPPGFRPGTETNRDVSLF